MRTQSSVNAPFRRVLLIRRSAALITALGISSPIAAQTATIPQRGDTLLVSLADAVGRALSVGDEARIAGAQRDATNGQVTSARATALPQLRFTGGYTQTLENARASIVSSVFGQRNNYNGNVNLTV